MMKEQTRRDYIDDVHKARQVLSRIVGKCENSNVYWSGWSRLDKEAAEIAHKLGNPLLEASEIKSYIARLLSGVNSLANAVTGNANASNMIAKEDVDKIVEDAKKDPDVNKVLEMLAKASSDLLQAWGICCKINPLIAKVPFFIGMKSTATMIGVEWINEVAKTPGLVKVVESKKEEKRDEAGPVNND